MARFFEDNFWGRVDQRLMDLGMTMVDFSKAIKIPTGTIYRQRREGDKPPKQDQIDKMAYALGCTAEFLLTGKNAEQNTLSPDLQETINKYKILNEDQKDVVRGLISQFVKDNAEYGYLYSLVHKDEM